MLIRASVVAVVSVFFAASASAITMGSTPVQLAPAPTTPADTAYQLAISRLAESDLTGAEQGFSESLKLEPGSVKATLGLAEVAFKRGKIEDAGRLIKQTITKSPHDANAQHSLGRYFLLTKRYQDAEAALKKSVSLDPNAASTQVDLGDLYATVLNKPHEAAAAYAAAVAADPKLAGSHYALGVTLANLGERDKARTELEKAAQIEPGNPLPVLALARVQSRGGDTAGALRSVDQALKIQPGLLTARELRGDILQMRGDQAGALKEYAAVIRAQPKAAGIQLKIGMVYESDGQYDDAVRAYRAAADIEPKLALAYNNLAWLAATRKLDLGQAESWAKHAVELGPKVAQFRDTLGWVYRAKGMKREAVKELDEASRLAPNDPGILYHLGVAYSESGNSTKARETLQLALKTSATFSDAADAKRLLSLLPR